MTLSREALIRSWSHRSNDQGESSGREVVRSRSLFYGFTLGTPTVMWSQDLDGSRWIVRLMSGHFFCSHFSSEPSTPASSKSGVIPKSQKIYKSEYPWQIIY
jgi:hypothetical protein